jgi:hypothetical protein
MDRSATQEGNDAVGAASPQDDDDKEERKTGFTLPSFFHWLDFVI